jgi:hypothetical protein
LPETHASAVAAAAATVTATATVTSTSSSSNSASAMDVDIVVEQQQQVQVEAVVGNGVLQDSEVVADDTDDSSSNAQQHVTFNSGNGPLTAEQLDPLVSVLQLCPIEVHTNVTVFLCTLLQCDSVGYNVLVSNVQLCRLYGIEET